MNKSILIFYIGWRVFDSLAALNFLWFPKFNLFPSPCLDLYISINRFHKWLCLGCYFRTGGKSLPIPWCKLVWACFVTPRPSRASKQCFKKERASKLCLRCCHLVLVHKQSFWRICQCHRELMMNEWINEVYFAPPMCPSCTFKHILLFAIYYVFYNVRHF